MNDVAHGCFMLGSLAALTAATATAQTQYPAKSIRLIVPFAAGGASDFTARTLAHKISAS